MDRLNKNIELFMDVTMDTKFWNSFPIYFLNQNPKVKSFIYLGISCRISVHSYGEFTTTWTVDSGKVNGLR